MLKVIVVVWISHFFKANSFLCHMVAIIILIVLAKIHMDMYVSVFLSGPRRL